MSFSHSLYPQHLDSDFRSTLTYRILTKVPFDYVSLAHQQTKARHPQSSPTILSPSPHRVQLNHQRLLLPHGMDLLLEPIIRSLALQIEMPHEARGDDLHLDVGEVLPDAVPRPVREGLQGLPRVVPEPGVRLVVVAHRHPALRDEVVRPRPVLRAARRRVDRDADRDARGHELPVDGAAAGRHDAVVRLRRGRVQAQGLLDARE